MRHLGKNINKIILFALSMVISVSLISANDILAKETKKTDKTEKKIEKTEKKTEQKSDIKTEKKVDTDTEKKTVQKKGVYHVAHDGTGDFDSLASAVVLVPSGSTLVIHEGVYNEALDIQSKIIHMKGVSRDKCVIQYDTSNYARVPLNIAGGSFENLTINGYHKAKQTAAFPGYAIHIDCDTLAGQAVVFTNCNIISENAFCVGIGLRKGAKVAFRGCNFTAKKQGAILFHDSQTPSLAGTASLSLENCVINNSSEGLIVTQCISPASTTNLTLRNNTVIGKGDGYCLAYGSYAGDGAGWMGANNVILTRNSEGNNIMSFNYSDMMQYNASIAQQSAVNAVSNTKSKSSSGKYYTIRTEDGIEMNVPIETVNDVAIESIGIDIPKSTSITNDYHTIRTEDGIEINVPGAY